MEASPGAQAAQPSLRKAFISASSWVLIQHVLLNVARFGSNLLLARLLNPEMFGLSQLVFVFVIGAQMFSDVGLNISVIQNRRGEEPLFLRCVWTAQVLRGGVLWILAALGSIPYASLYGYPELSLMITIACLGLVFQGFTSANLLVFQRRMQQRKITPIVLGGDLLGMLSMVLLAWHWQSPYVLLASSLVSSFVQMVLSYRLPGISMQFSWDASTWKEVMTFGGWIFLSSILTFFKSNIDKMFIGLYLSIEELGCYGIAVTIAMFSLQLVERLSGSVLLPLYSQLIREKDPSFHQKMTRARLGLLALTLPLLLGLSVGGKWLALSIYPERYGDVGWMIEILASGFCLSLLPITVGPVFLAAGDSFRQVLLVALRVVIQLILMWVGGVWYGAKGIVAGVAFAQFLVYPFTLYWGRLYGVRWSKVDFFVLAVCVLFLGVSRL